MGNIHVLKDACIGFTDFGICRFVCPKDVFHVGESPTEKGFYPPEVVDEDACTRCETCMISCPDMAIIVEGMTGGQVAPTTPRGARTITTPIGSLENAFDIAPMVQAAGASYVARWTAAHPRQRSWTLIWFRHLHDGGALIEVPATSIAGKEIGDSIVANLVILGALIGTYPVVSVEALEKAIQVSVPKSKIEINIKAFRRGLQFTSS